MIGATLTEERPRIESAPEPHERARGGRRAWAAQLGYEQAAASLRPPHSARARGGGSPGGGARGEALKRRFGELLGEDLAGVRLHLRSGLADAADAHGIAQQGHVHLDLDEPELGSAHGQRVLAHELVHVAQGRLSGVAPEPVVEREADTLADTLVSGGRGRAQAPSDPRRPLYKKRRRRRPAARARQRRRERRRAARRRPHQPAPTPNRMLQAARFNGARGFSHRTIRRLREALHMPRTAALGLAVARRVAAFQRSVGYWGTGRLDSRTVGRLRLHLRMSHGLRTLTNGERREAAQWNRRQGLPAKRVRRLQTGLHVNTDGVLGPETTEAAARFQRRTGLRVNGKLNRPTRRRLATHLRRSHPLTTGPKGGGNSARLSWAGKVAVQYGLSITSTTGGQHAPGSYHYKGRAIDVAGSAHAMARFYRRMKRERPTELFYDPLGGIKYGQEIGAIGGHRDHVHVAF